MAALTGTNYKLPHDNIMTLDEIISNYILNDGRFISTKLEFGESPSATISLKARKINSKKKIEDKTLELRLIDLNSC